MGVGFLVLLAHGQEVVVHSYQTENGQCKKPSSSHSVGANTCLTLLKESPFTVPGSVEPSFVAKAYSVDCNNHIASFYNDTLCNSTDPLQVALSPVTEVICLEVANGAAHDVSLSCSPTHSPTLFPTYLPTTVHSSEICKPVYNTDSSTCQKKKKYCARYGITMKW